MDEALFLSILFSPLINFCSSLRRVTGLVISDSSLFGSKSRYPVYGRVYVLRGASLCDEGRS